MRRILPGLIVSSSLLLAACGGGGSSPAVNPSGNGGTSGSSGTQSVAETAISSTNAFGAPVSDLSAHNSATSSLQSDARAPASAKLDVCQTNASGGSYEFYAPDKNNDPDSTEQQYFYDSSCTQLARDVVRVYASVSSSAETVTITTQLYAQGNATPIATRTDAVAISNATFDQYGFPVVADGFVRDDTSSLSLGTVKTFAADREFIIGPASGSTASYCGDSAGFNMTGIASLNETFGWQGATPSGTRTVNGDGSVTWTTTHAGATYKAPIGGLSIAAGTPNTSCPASTPLYTLTGGTSLGTYSIPTTVTFHGGLLIGLTITNATLANGNTLNAASNTGVSPTSTGFITGSVTSGTTSIATFSVDAFGDGTLTVSSTGNQYVITDWHVVK